MTDEASNVVDEAAENAAATNVHTLAVSMATIRRLLDRREPDGTLVAADAVLIRTALDTVRDEARCVRKILTMNMDGSSKAYREKATVMLDAVAELEDLLGRIDTAVRDWGG